MKIDPKYQKMAGTWLRAFIVAVIALVSAGVTDPKALLVGGLASVLPIVLRAINPNDPAYGVVKAINEEVQKQAKKPVKKAVKK